uniref:Kazal-like domain-containing protein n=1 Tax=Leptobrachium leishanense TaxID=445787 RepID=A0A8C5MZ91_9ANUR
MTTISIIVLVLAAFINFSGFTPVAGYEDECSKFKADESGMYMACPRVHDPVCGTDGKTYDNTCKLCEAKLTKQLIEVKHKGPCNSKGEKVDCESYRGRNACTLDYNPRCGSDGISYGNECQYCMAQNSKEGLTLMNVGRCAN